MLSKKLADVPEVKAKQFPERLTIAVTPEMKKQFKLLKKKYHRDNMAWVRNLIQKGLEDLGVEFEEELDEDEL